MVVDDGLVYSSVYFVWLLVMVQSIAVFIDSSLIPPGCHHCTHFSFSFFSFSGSRHFLLSPASGGHSKSNNRNGNYPALCSSLYM